MVKKSKIVSVLCTLLILFSLLTPVMGADNGTTDQVKSKISDLFGIFKVEVPTADNSEATPMLPPLRGDDRALLQGEIKEIYYNREILS